MTNVIDKLAWTPVRNRRVLFARTRGQTLFYTVGGKRKTGESDVEALLREVKEETRATLLHHSIHHIHTFTGTAHGAPEGTALKLACYAGTSVCEPVPSSEIKELTWFTTADMPRTTETGQAILRWFADQGLID